MKEVMRGFESIAGLAYCTGAIEGTNIRWHNCPKDQ